MADKGVIHEYWEWFTDFPEFTEWIGDWGVSRGLFLIALFCGLYFILGGLIPNLWLFTFNWLVGTAPIWMPISLLIGFWKVWVWYAQSLYLSGRNPILLEVRMPREISKSPRAMEVALAQFWLSSGETTFLHRGWKGQVRPNFALEIVSFGGDIHFYVWCWKNNKSLVEAALYGQYPEVELYEVEDYASKFRFDPEIHSTYCTDWRLEPAGKGGPYGAGGFPSIDAYPIKTYVDFELDKDPKEEFKVDPLGTVLEFMHNIQPHEQIWLQLVIRRCGKYGVLRTHERDEEWRKAVVAEVNKVRREAAIKPGEVLEEGEVPQGFPHPTWRQQQQVQSMERNLGKLPFEVVGHATYITSKDLHGPSYTTVRWIWKPLGNPAYMSHLRPRRWHNPYDYPWQDFHDFRWNLHAKRFFDCYRRRGGFQSPWILNANVLSVEVLATLWHPPSATVATPGLQRIPATKASAPANLPV